MRAWWWTAAALVPSVALGSEAGLASACAGGDEVACERAGLGVARGDWSTPSLGGALEKYLGPSCGRGHVSSCLVGLVAVRGAKTVDVRAERALLTGACLGGATFACYEVAQAQPDVAARALDVACRRGEVRACGLRDGAAESWHPIEGPEGLGLRHLGSLEVVEAESLAGMPHHVALRSQDGKLEVRILVEPLTAAAAEYRECVLAGGCASSNPDAGFTTRYELTAQALSNGDMSPGEVLAEPLARARFEAEWAASRVVGLRSDLGSEFASAVIFSAHRDGVADVTVLGLYDDYASIEGLWTDTLAGVRFTGPVGLGLRESD